MIRLRKNEILQTLKKTLQFVDAVANADANTNNAADAEGSTIPLREHCSGELKMLFDILFKLSHVCH